MSMIRLSKLYKAVSPNTQRIIFNYYTVVPTAVQKLLKNDFLNEDIFDSQELCNIPGKVCTRSTHLK